MLWQVLDKPRTNQDLSVSAATAGSVGYLSERAPVTPESVSSLTYRSV